ncbi:hypothetical protein K456DRAFT_407050 [Colletotrichum gloeosporioides 23]|nr:hypothetical protein K456DRAFT_407050 [Colletotrichum gloeosporioides 23]
MHITSISLNIPMSDSSENTPTFPSFYHHHHHHHYHHGLINIYAHSIILNVDCLIHTLVTRSLRPRFMQWSPSSSRGDLHLPR